MADKTKTIKNATDKELEDLIKRLRQENELQNLISEIVRKTKSGYVDYGYNMEISTETPIKDLYHVGILGMKWGRRREKKATTTNTSPEHKNKVLLKKKKISEMTNSELKTLNERLKLERSYKELKSTDMSAGKKFIMDLVINTGKQLVQSYVQKNAGELLKKVLG